MILYYKKYVYLKKKHVKTKSTCVTEEKNNGRKIQKFEELRGIENVRINMFKYFCDYNKGVEKILMEDISNNIQILHETKRFNSSLHFMQEKLSENNQNKSLALVLCGIYRKINVKL